MDKEPLGVKASELLLSDERPCLIYMATGNNGKDIKAERFAGNRTSKLRKNNRIIIVNPDSFGEDLLEFYTLYEPDEKLFRKGIMDKTLGGESRVFHDSDKTRQFSYTVICKPEEAFEAIIREFEEMKYSFEGR